jgi:hypothetical protein
VWPWVTSLANCGTDVAEDCTDDEDLVDGNCVPKCSPSETRNSSTGQCDPKPECEPDEDGNPRTRDETTGECVRVEDVGSGGGGGGGGSSYKTYGSGPDQPWDVDLGYLEDAPAFSFDYEDWVEPDPFTYPAYEQPDPFTYAAYQQPDPFSYPEFVPPTGQEALESPGYQFRVDEGIRSLQARAAAAGLLRTGRTLKELMDYGQNTASEEYQKVYNRRLKEWQEGSGLAERAYAGNLAAGQWGYGENLGAAERAYAANVGAGQFGYQTNLASSQDQWRENRAAQLEGHGMNRVNAWNTAVAEFKPVYDSWAKQQDARDRAAFAKYGRQGEAWRAANIPAATMFTVGAGLGPPWPGPIE